MPAKLIIYSGLVKSLSSRVICRLNRQEVVKCLFEMCGAPRQLVCHRGKFLIYYPVKCDEYLQALRDKCCVEIKEKLSFTVSFW